MSLRIGYFRGQGLTPRYNRSLNMLKRTFQFWKRGELNRMATHWNHSNQFATVKDWFCYKYEISASLILPSDVSPVQYNFSINGAKNNIKNEAFNFKSSSRGRSFILKKTVLKEFIKRTELSIKKNSSIVWFLSTIFNKKPTFPFTTNLRT